MANEKQDIFADSGRQNPAAHALAVSAGSGPFPWGYSRAIYVGGAGDLTVRMASDESIVTFANVAAGMYYPIRASEIMASSTASNFTVMW